MRVLIHIPSRQRPERGFRAVRNHLERTAISPPYTCELRLSLDADDPTLPEYAWGLAKLQSIAAERGILLRTIVGPPKASKHAAVNRDLPDRMESRSFDLMVFSSDDMEIVGDDWLDRVCSRHRALSLNGSIAIRCPDGNRRDLMTWPILATAMYRTMLAVRRMERGIWDERYITEYADNQLQALCMRYGTLIDGPDDIVRHHHPAFGGPNDALYERNRDPELVARDRATWEQERRTLAARS